jgi:hypothetical protein
MILQNEIPINLFHSGEKNMRTVKGKKNYNQQQIQQYGKEKIK